MDPEWFLPFYAERRTYFPILSILVYQNQIIDSLMLGKKLDIFLDTRWDSIISVFNSQIFFQKFLFQPAIFPFILIPDPTSYISSGHEIYQLYKNTRIDATNVTSLCHCKDSWCISCKYYFPNPLLSMTLNNEV